MRLLLPVTSLIREHVDTPSSSPLVLTKDVAMPARHRVALALCLLALAAPAMAYRELQQTCRTQRVDKYFKFVVESKICNWWKPGQNSTYGGATFGVLPFFPAECIVANNSFPGPTIKVNKGDWVQVDVQSRLTGREITIHWHGLKQEGTPWADGASMINSCPINPGQTQTYLFHADDPGLYFWHGHGGLEEEYGLSGALEIVDPDDPYEQNHLYDEELEKHVETRDWWMAPDAHAAQAHTMRFYQQLWPHGVPLVNGFYGNGTANLPYYSMNLTANTCYRTKFICANTQWPGWFISINDQNNQPVNMTMITLTGENLQPLNTHRFAYYIAQRAEAVICTGAPGVTWRMLVNSSQPEDGYCRDGPQSAANAFGNLSVPGCINHMTVELNIIPEGANPRPKRANRALLQTYPFVQTFDSLVHPEHVVPWEPVNVPQNPTQTWNIFVGVSPGGGGEGNMYAWEERDYGLAMPSAPPLFTRGGRCGTADPPRPGQIPIRGVTDKAWLQKTVRYGEVVDIIFNNLSPFYHPMHLHGYDFTVLASRYYVDAGYTIQPQNICPTGFRWVVPSWDSITTGPPWPRQAPLGGGFAAFAFGCPYNATENNTRWDLPNPYVTDIVPVPAHGWTKVRVRFNNPGSWFLHCHLAVHMIRGMGFMVNAAIDRVPRIPSWVDTSCVGSCRVQGQICGDYAPPRSQISQCSAAQDVCVPRGLSSMMSGK